MFCLGGCSEAAVANAGMEAIVPCFEVGEERLDQILVRLDAVCRTEQCVTQCVGVVVVEKTKYSRLSTAR